MELVQFDGFQRPRVSPYLIAANLFNRISYDVVGFYHSPISVTLQRSWLTDPRSDWEVDVQWSSGGRDKAIDEGAALTNFANALRDAVSLRETILATIDEYEAAFQRAVKKMEADRDKEKQELIKRRDADPAFNNEAAKHAVARAVDDVRCGAEAVVVSCAVRGEDKFTYYVGSKDQNRITFKHVALKWTDTRDGGKWRCVNARAAGRNEVVAALGKSSGRRSSIIRCQDGEQFDRMVQAIGGGKP
jgi:hypothetical protein